MVISTILDRSLETLAFLERFIPIRTGPTLPLTPQTMLDACIQNFFLVSTLYSGGGGGWGGGPARKFRTGFNVLRGNREMTEKCEHCSTVLRTFVQDLNGFEVMQLFSWGGASNHPV